MSDPGQPLTPPSQGSWGPPPPQPYAGWPPLGPPPDSTASHALRTARTALGWAIGAAVGAGLALVGVLRALLLGGQGGVEEDDFSYETLRGEVVGLPEGSPLSGDRLERPLVDELREYGTDDVVVSCPDTEAVSVSTVVVCTGEVDGHEWTGVVVFEDSAGSFAVIEL